MLVIYNTCKLTKIMNMKKQIKDVKTFHDSFGIKNLNSPSLNNESFNLRYKLMKEENDEYLNACKDGDIVEIADALGDMMYILCGTILSHGLQHKIEEVFEEIQSSNMSKLGVNGKPILREDGKILKGPNYFKPNILNILKK